MHRSSTSTRSQRLLGAIGLGRTARGALCLAIATSSLLALAPAAGAERGDPSVTIEDATSCLDGSLFCYRPAALSLDTGDVVTVTNSSFDIHSVTRCTVAACGAGNVGDGAQSFDTGHLSSGQQAQIQLTEPGTYVYYCTIHGYSIMHGSFTVDGSAGGHPKHASR